MAKKSIEILARAVIVRRGRILLCRRKAADYLFLPGGHVEFDEDIATALKRELKEEIDADVASARFIGVWENQFIQEGIQKPKIKLVKESKIKTLATHVETNK